MTLKRIHREISDIQKEDLGKITLGPQDIDNPFSWRARIPGPEGSVYEGGVFDVEIQLANDYPYVSKYSPVGLIDKECDFCIVSRRRRCYFLLGEFSGCE